MSKFSVWLDNTLGEENVNKAVGILDPLGLTELGSQGQGVKPPDLNIPDPQARNPQVDTMTSELYQQMLGLMDQQANTDVTNQQIGSLSDILNHQATLAGKNMAGASFAAGSATPANIAPIEQAKSSAFAKGIVDIQNAEQARIDKNQATALSLISDLRSSLAAEDLARFDNSMNAAMFEWQRYIDQKGLELSEDEKEMEFFTMVTEVVLGFAVGGPAGAGAAVVSNVAGS